MVDKIKEFVLGKAKDPLDPAVFHNLSLIAFFAWVGLGADGLSSSCYGPEEAFITLGHFSHLAIFLAIAMAATVFILSASYSQIIELFPSGGGGYLVATRLIGPVSGLVSGCSLLVDYILTISISISAGMDAIFSFLPHELHSYKLIAVIACLVLLIVLNLRGVKESVMVLTPIFLIFLVTHAIVIFYGILSHGENLHGLVSATVYETNAGLTQLGFFAMAVIFLRAFCLGGGTFTGIEAVSNGLQILREPRVATGKRTMLYMAISLSFTAGGILVCYLLNDIHLVPGQTLNATLIHSLADGWPFGGLFILVTLLSEGGLLLVAAQGSFLAGPRVMSNMALDKWLPGRFKNLSDRLVIKDGILVMGVAALLIILYTGASVRILVVMYSINVFLTFSLSQYGMVKHWLKVREAGRWRKFSVSFTGLVLTVGILVVTSIIKFQEGGWMTLLITGGSVAFCFWVNHHYRMTTAALRHLDETLKDIPFPSTGTPAERDPSQATACLMVNGYNGIGIHSFLAIHKAYPGYFKNFVFISVGVIDSDQFKGVAELGNLKKSIRNDLDQYEKLANNMGFYAESAMTLETDVTLGLERLCRDVSANWSHVVFFTGQLVFENETQPTRFLHNQTCFAIQRRLLFNGLDVAILPIRVRLKK